MEKDGRFWPTDMDRTARKANFHVPISPLAAPEEEFQSGSVTVLIEEEASDVEERLREQFLAYRVAKLIFSRGGRGGQDGV